MVLQVAMVSIVYLASTVLMAVFTVGIVFAMLRLGDLRGYSVDREDSTEGLEAFGERLTSFGSNQTVWMVVFFALVVVFGGAVWALLSGAVSPSMGAAGVVGGALALVLVGYVLFGSYRMVKTHGRSTAEAVGISAWALGSLLVIAIAAKLVVG